MKRIKMPPFKLPRVRKWVIIFFSLTACILFLGLGVLTHYIGQQIEKRLQLLGCNVGAVNVNIFSRTVTLSAFDLTPAPDSADQIPVKAQIKNIAIKNVSLYDILANKELIVKEVLVEDGTVQLNRKKKKQDIRRQTRETTVKKISVGRVIINNINMAIGADSLPLYSGILNLKLFDVQSSDTTRIDNLKAYSIRDIEATLHHLLLNSANGFYQIRIGTVFFASSEEKLRVDSLTLIPKYPKYKFSRVAGKQIDRVNSFIPSIEITGLKYDHLRDSVFMTSKIEIISPEVYSFRDKRMTFKETKNKPLPIAALRRFNMDVEIDTIKITDAKITYEEFPPDGFKSGKVVFEDLQAVMVNVSNKVYENKPRYATLDASAKIMGKGLIQAAFQLPLDEDKPYHAKGKINQLALHHLNPALENLAFIRIESGRLNNLDFDFTYNDRSSKGALTINYQDLKLTGLKKERSPDESDFKTFLINTIVKNDKDKDVPLEKRTGAIEFERDRKRQIFNFWWKSLLSGIKASVLSSEKSAGKSKDSRKK
jgi:hypothetical protein